MQQQSTVPKTEPTSTPRLLQWVLGASPLEFVKRYNLGIVIVVSMRMVRAGVIAGFLVVLLVTSSIAQEHGRGERREAGYCALCHIL
jgi:hypothetical protein